MDKTQTGEHDNNFDELAGRTEGISRMLILLTAFVEDAGIINGPRFSTALRRAFQLPEDAPDLLVVAQRTVRQMADGIDEFRQLRQE